MSMLDQFLKPMLESLNQARDEFPAEEVAAGLLSLGMKFVYDIERSRERNWEKMGAAFGMAPDQAKTLYRMVLDYAYREKE